MVTNVDMVPHVYILAKYESMFNHHRYYDRPDGLGNYTRTFAEKQFHIFSGKAAELELQRLRGRRGDTAVEGTLLFSGKPDKGIDQAYERFGSVQAKFRHGLEFSIDVGTLKFCAGKGCRLVVAKCDEFYDDYSPKNTSSSNYVNWREPPVPPVKTYSEWYIYEVDVTKAVQDNPVDKGSVRFKFSDRKYVKWMD